jgi:hypothetical protein
VLANFAARRLKKLVERHLGYTSNGELRSKGGQRSACKAIRNLRIVKDVERAPITVIETDRFLKDAKHLMPESEQLKLVAFVAANPRAGDLIPETRGVRKLRWALPGQR